jgi:hypothetical protein
MTLNVRVNAVQSRQTQAGRPNKGEIMGRFNGTKLSIGNLDLISGSDGYSGTIQHIGNFDFFNDNRGNHGTVTHIGDFDFFDFNGLSGDILHIGGRNKRR